MNLPRETPWLLSGVTVTVAIAAIIWPSNPKERSESADRPTFSTTQTSTSSAHSSHLPTVQTGVTPEPSPTSSSTDSISVTTAQGKTQTTSTGNLTKPANSAAPTTTTPTAPTQPPVSPTPTTISTAAPQCVDYTTSERYYYGHSFNFSGTSIIQGPLYDPSPLLIYTRSWITGYVYKVLPGSSPSTGSGWTSQFELELLSQGASNVQTVGSLIIGTIGRFNIEMGPASRYSSEYANSTDTYALGYWIEKRCY